ncbi:protein kinase-like domain, Phloem protein 2-like protein [Artemisia annua]|uniref:Protein kinase-like domain, Phloem protein 2-like protein n=1 Tax=Artemisia annua TaxID=35608 RepID=A0A2U1NHR9_ARTAN|nr:protein kinase-like domain, Phloem protein 2-like protein [Artemisia annua]
MQHEDIEGFKSLLISDEKDIDNDDDEYWEKKLPDGYQHYIEMSDKPLNHTTKKELYFLLCEGFLADNGHLWLSLCKSTGMICSMLSATDILTSRYKRVDTLPKSKNRFTEVAEVSNSSGGLSFTCQIQSHMFSPQYAYACYLVFKFENHDMRPNKSYMFRAYYELDDIQQDSCLVDLKHRTEMDIPTINPKYGSHDTSYIPRTEALSLRKCHIEHGLFCWAEQREDGLMDEVMVCKPLQGLEHHTTLNVKLLGDSDRLGGMIVEGVEFRPYLNF